MASKRTIYPPLMPHEQRRLLIEAPIIFRYIPKKTWGGLYIRSEPLPVEGRRRYAPTPEDEEAYRIHFQERGE